MRIEFGNHAFDRTLDQTRTVHRFYVFVLDENQHPTQLVEHMVGAVAFGPCERWRREAERQRER